MKTFTVECGPEQPNGGRARRSVYAKEGLTRSPGGNVHTLYDILTHSAKKYPDRKGFGFRKVEKTVSEEKEVTKYINGEEVKQMKTWNFFQMSGYNYLSYKEASRLAHDVGSGLAQIGLKEKSKIEIFSPTK